MTITVEADVHPDPVAEAVRFNACENGVIQITGRGRGVNRTAGNPVSIVILNNLDLPIEIDELRDWSPPTIDDQMLAQGFWLENAADAASVLCMKYETVRKARQRSGTKPYKYIPIGKGPGPTLREATYQRTGAGRHSARFIYDERIIVEPRAWLEGKHLDADIKAFIDKHNENPKPYKWTKSADEILASVKRFCQRTNQTLCHEL